MTTSVAISTVAQFHRVLATVASSGGERWQHPAVELLPVRQSDRHEAALRHRATTIALAELAVLDVPVGDIGTTQPTLNLHAIAHYLHQPEMPYDPDPWFDSDVPVLGQHPTQGLLVLDGNSRLAAARLTGRSTILARVVHTT